MKQWLALVKEAVNAWINDSAPSKGAALAYYATFSIAPLLFIAISVAGLLFGTDAVQGAVFGQLADLMGENGARAVQEMLGNLQRPKHGLIGAGVGIALLLLGASTVFGQLQSALDSIWQVPIPPKASGVWDFLRARLLPIGMVFGMAFLVIVSLLFTTAIAALGKWWGPLFSEGVAHVLDLSLSFALLVVGFALIYRYVPRATIKWRDVWVGAAVTAALFTIGKWAIGLYLGKSTVASSFGAFASLVIVMVWVYYSAQIFLLGAEFTWVYARNYGSRRGVAPDVEEIPVTSAANEPLIGPFYPGSKKLQRPNPGAIAAALIGGIALRLIVARTPWRRKRRYMFE
ncbi:MAG TPA: YihY/virulence factor BrkB family protein [Burkholderiales bacterium]|jgi:membrane protein